jgi:hypothetical protein
VGALEGAFEVVFDVRVEGRELVPASGVHGRPS